MKNRVINKDMVRLIIIMVVKFCKFNCIFLLRKKMIIKVFIVVRVVVRIDIKVFRLCWCSIWLVIIIVLFIIRLSEIVILVSE